MPSREIIKTVVDRMIANGAEIITEQRFKVTEIANPAAVAWRWTNDEFEHEITWIRGSGGLLFGTKGLDGRWNSTPITNPERFGFDGTLSSARRAAERFVNS